MENRAHQVRPRDCLVKSTSDGTAAAALFWPFQPFSAFRPAGFFVQSCSVNNCLRLGPISTATALLLLRARGATSGFSAAEQLRFPTRLSRYGWIWWVPEIRVPPNHLLLWDFPLYTILDTSIYGSPHMAWAGESM